jgi:hypothetical protein
MNIDRQEASLGIAPYHTDEDWQLERECEPVDREDTEADIADQDGEQA